MQFAMEDLKILMKIGEMKKYHEEVLLLTLWWALLCSWCVGCRAAAPHRSQMSPCTYAHCPIPYRHSPVAPNGQSSLSASATVISAMATGFTTSAQLRIVAVCAVGGACCSVGGRK